MDKIKNLEEETLDVSDIDNIDIKINPDYYIHKAILAAQKALAEETDLKVGLAKFRLIIEHIIILAKAASMIDGEFLKEIELYKQDKEYKETKEEYIKNFYLANKKLEFILNNIFKNKTATSPLKL